LALRVLLCLRRRWMQALNYQIIERTSLSGTYPKPVEIDIGGYRPDKRGFLTPPNWYQGAQVCHTYRFWNFGIGSCISPAF
jgi:hypothetical protein